MSSEIPQRELDLQKLVTYLAAQPDGQELGYVRITQDTGLPMLTFSQRSLLRAALRRLKRNYLSKWGYGIILSSAENSTDISGSRFDAARRGVKRFRKTCTSLVEKHGPAMSRHDQQMLIRDSALAGAVELTMQDHYVKREAHMAEKPKEPYFDDFMRK